MSNQIEVKIGQSCNGYHGLIEQPKYKGLDVRVLEVLDDGSVVYRHFDAWFSFGERARTYGTPFKADAFCIC